MTSGPELPDRSLTPRRPPAPRFAASSPRGYLGLRGKIVIFAVLLAVVPLLVSSISMITSTRDELKSSVNGSLLTTTKEVMGQVRLAVEPALQTLFQLRDALDSPALSVDNKVALLHGAIQNLDGLEAIQLAVDGRPPVYLFRQAFKIRLDEAGLAPARILPTPAVSASERAGTDSITVGEPLYLSSLEIWRLPLWVFLHEPIAGRPALLVAYLDLGDLQRSLEAHPLWQSGGIRLTDRQGAPIFSEPSRSSVPGQAEPAGATGTAGTGTVSVAPYQHSDGTAMVSTVGMIETPPWRVVVAVSEQQAYAIVDRMQTQLTLWLGLGLAVAVIGALMLAHRISRPIREMAVVTQQVGSGNFQIRVRAGRRRDEIGTLGTQLNLMIQGLSESHRRLDHLAHHDALTGLPNRLSILNHLGRVLTGATHGGDSAALLFLDLDRFKSVNDSLGHSVGDQLLKLAAERLCACLADGDIAARLRSDEFLVLLTSVNDRQTTSAVAETIIDAFSAPFQLMTYELYVGATIGISTAPADGTVLTELIDKADMAMYKAKERGRGHYQFFDSELKAKAIRQLSLEGQLRRALERSELDVFYQPKVVADSGLIVGMEALVRWPDRQGGFIASPSEFIPLAEESGLVAPLGEWVLLTTCLQAQAWHRAGLPGVTAAVNVSARQFGRRDFFKRVRQTVEHSGLDASYLELELTEGLLLDDTNQAIALMDRFKEMGIQLSIDDFGTGFSSLAYLRLLPLDYLKVAQEFVRGIETNRDDAMIVGAVIALAKSLGLKVIAEGVETDNELAFLHQRGCDMIQGYYFSRPLPADQFEALLTRGGTIVVPPRPSARDGRH